MKTIVKQITAGTFIALLLLVGNAKAAEIKRLNLKVSETNLQLESWMTNESVWNPYSIEMAEYSQEMEEALNIENWMTSAEAWNSNFDFVEASEQSLELESWMTDEKTWNEININESALALEAWMTNENLWN